jgi:hypothetical protein
MCLPIAATATKTMRSATTLSLRSLRNARYAPAEMDNVRHAAAQRRGGAFDGLGTAVVLNLHPARAPAAGVRFSPTTFEWRGRTDQENLGFYLDAYQTDEGFVLGASIDTALLEPGEAEKLLRAMEWLIVSAASREVPISELHAYLRDG